MSSSSAKSNLAGAIEKARRNDAEKLRDLRGLLAPFLRDTLVGFNYVHYAPPGAQILLTNPLFVRNSRFPWRAGLTTDLAAYGSLRLRVAVERRWPARRIAVRAALRAGRSRTELPDSLARTGADLGRSRTSDDSDGEGPAMVERHAGADCTGSAFT